jgi:hypothetical protein
MNRYLLAAAVVLAGLSGVVRAQPAARSSQAGIELNRLEARAEGCRVWLLLRNPTTVGHDRLRLDLLLFGRDGVIARRMLIDAGQLPAEKTMARIFDAPGLACDAIGSVLLNDIPMCGTEPCLPHFATSSRVPDVALDR